MDIIFIFDNLAVVAPVKYECDLKNLMIFFLNLKYP